MDALVGIDLVTAGHLAAALERAGRVLAARSDEGRAAAHAVGLTAAPAGRVATVAAWAEGEARGLRALITRLERLDGGPVRWHGGTDVDFAHPFEAWQWGRSIAAALVDGDTAWARRLLAAHAGDPVVATVLLAALGPDHLLQELRVGQYEWTRGTGQRELVLALGEAFALAARNGTCRWTFDDLADRADAAQAPRSALALLFAGGARFPTELVRGAVASLVAPLSAAVIQQPGLGVQPWMVGGLDARVVVLEAAARDPRAAREAVGSVDLDDLLPGSAAYLDGGVALARVLLAATVPVDSGLAAVNAQRVIEWVGRHRQVPLAVHVELGRLAAPWIGSFRSAGLDDVVPRRLSLDETLARSYLTYAQARDRAADALQEAAWHWAADELDRLDGVSGYDAVGSVLGLVTTTRLDAEAAMAVTDDRRTTRQNALWRQVTRLALTRLTGPARQIASPVVNLALNQLLPVADHELRHWRDGRDPAVLHEQLALEHLIASTLWANGIVRDATPQLLVDPADPAQGLRNPLTLSAADAAIWTHWRSGLVAGGHPALQVASDQFLRETRE